MVEYGALARSGHGLRGAIELRAGGVKPGGGAEASTAAARVLEPVGVGEAAGYLYIRS
jgi:hypothetical protein